MRLIDADALIDDVMDRYCCSCDKRKGMKNGKYRIVYRVGDAPCRACDIDDMKCELDDAPTIDAVPVVHGKWEQREVFDSKVVDQLQSAFCPVCKRYHTTPYSYYFSNYNYCPNCGAKMDGGENDAVD